MTYTAKDAKENMSKLIKGLQEKYDELLSLRQTPGIKLQERAEIDFEMSKLSSEIDHRTKLAAFDEAAATVIGPPSDAEIAELKETLEMMGRDIKKIANIKSVIEFVENVMTENAKRFIEIGKTIRTA